MTDEYIAILVIFGLIIIAYATKDIAKSAIVLSIIVNALIGFAMIKKAHEKDWFSTIKEKFDHIIFDEGSITEQTDLIYPDHGVAKSQPTQQMKSRSGDRAGFGYSAPGYGESLLGGTQREFNRNLTTRSHGYRNQSDRTASTRPGYPDQNCMGEKNIDTAITQFWRRKGDRDKQAIDGRMSRTANQLKYYGYADESAREETRVWWGEDDY